MNALRSSRSRGIALVIAILIAVVAVASAIVVSTINEGAPRVSAGVARAFGDDAMLRARGGTARVVFSPTGNNLIVIDGEGVALAEAGELRPVTRRGTNAVDAAWFPSETAVLVAEGPIPTGELAVVELDGSVRGTVLLDPTFGVGRGHGTDVSFGGTRAVVTAETREAIGGLRRTHLVLVDLTTGATSDLTPSDGADEFGPVHLGETQLAFTARTESGSAVTVRDLETGASARVSGSDEDAHVVGQVAGEPAYATGRTVWVGADPESRKRLVTVAAGAGRVVAVHPEGRAVVTRTGTVLRLVMIDR